jgi:hypothetical protein
MQVYNFDPNTFEYLGASTAFESPLEPGVYLVPANATATPVPTFNAATQQCYWINGAWTVSTIVATAPTQPTAAELAAAAWSTYQTQAQAALTRSDVTMLRCFESGSTPPSAWVVYRKALRAIVGALTGDPSAPLPSVPSYPAD